MKTYMQKMADIGALIARARRAKAADTSTDEAVRNVMSAEESAKVFTSCAQPAPEVFLGSKARGLTAGQEVRLNSCDVWMTVLYADCCEAHCGWFDGQTLHQETFPLACVTNIPSMPF